MPFVLRNGQQQPNSTETVNLLCLHITMATIHNAGIGLAKATNFSIQMETQLELAEDSEAVSRFISWIISSKVRAHFARHMEMNVLQVILISSLSISRFGTLKTRE